MVVLLVVPNVHFILQCNHSSSSSSSTSRTYII